MDNGLGISKKYIPLLLELESDPLMNLKDLAKRVGVSWPTVKKRMEEARTESIIIGTIAHFNYRKIGLNRVTIIATVPDYRGMKMLEEACNVHPYTVYRSRIFGQHFGLFMTFNIPPSTQARGYLYAFLDKLKEENLIIEYTSFEGFGQGLRIKSDLKRYDLENNKWTFNWQYWMSSIQKHNDPLPENSNELIDFNELSEKRLMLLRHLTRDATLKQTDFMDILDLSRTEAHRHYNYVMDNMVEQVELIYDRMKFDLIDQYLYVIPNATEEMKRNFYHGTVNNPPPFTFLLNLTDGDNILIGTHTNPMLANQLGYELWKQYPQTKMYTLSITQYNTYRYFFYHLNFDLEGRKWRDDEHYMVTEPLQSLGLAELPSEDS